jgi:hypothetical protein
VLLSERSSMNHAEILSLSTDKPATKFDDGPSAYVVFGASWCACRARRRW